MPESSPKAHDDRPRMTTIIAAWVIVFSLTAGWIYEISIFRPAKNFHEVDPGKFYRSAQLTGAEFAQAIDRYRIKTIINLRGTGAGEPWYDEELKAANDRAVKLFSFGFSTKDVPHRKSLLPLLEALRTAERPLLVHCRSGTDRTGEVSAIYAMTYMAQDKETALEQLGLRYLYIPLFAPAKRLFVEDWQGEDWAIHHYDPCSPRYKDYYEQSAGNCPSVFPPAIADGGRTDN